MTSVIRFGAPLLAVAFLWLVPHTAAAQGLAEGPRVVAESPVVAPAVAGSLLAEPELAELAGIPTTYWKEGAWTGAIVFGLLGVAFSAGMCNYAETDENCLAAGALTTAIFAGIGFGLGALVGGQFPKGEPTAAEVGL